MPQQQGRDCLDEFYCTAAVCRPPGKEAERTPDLDGSLIDLARWRVGMFLTFLMTSAQDLSIDQKDEIFKDP